MTKEFRAAEGRLDRVVAERLRVPRADVQRAIERGFVLVDGQPREKSHLLRGGERISVDLPPAEAIAPDGPPVDVRYSDEFLHVVSKPGGLVTHPTASRPSGTLVNRLLGMGMPLAAAGGPLRPGIVHRLDAGTSGLLIVAADDETYVALQRMMRTHEVDRRYVAMVKGDVPHGRFVVEAPLERKRARIVIRRATGRPAETAFEVRERFPNATLLEAAPRTGRTHQIRVHLSAIGHPILGDRPYGGGGEDAKRLGLSRPFLHARRLSFIHPRTGKAVDVEDPLPAELEKALAKARAESPS
ncbi:MAG: RluA family pseudouridine synthase [Actinomycetota bacterium]